MRLGCASCVESILAGEQLTMWGLCRYTPVPENDFLETVFRPVYDQGATYQGSGSSHVLAVLLMVLAIGSLLDLERPATSPEAMQYYQLARAALALDSVIEEQSIPGIQALVDLHVVHPLLSVS